MFYEQSECSSVQHTRRKTNNPFLHTGAFEPELIPILCSQLAGDRHKPRGIWAALVLSAPKDRAFSVTATVHRTDYDKMCCKRSPEQE